MADRSARSETNRESVSRAAVPTMYVLNSRGGGVTAQEQLDLERQRRENFVSTLAHELRQPLATLLASVEVVRLSSNNPTTDRATGIMKRQIAQMNRVVEDLLDAARWARGKVTLRRQCFDLRDVIREAAQDLAASIAEQGHELVVVTPSDPLWIDADPQRLHQVLSNLLRNAVRYTDPGGRITLTAEREAMRMTLCVSDTGRGMEPEALSSIFELFAQVRPAEAAGVGIGLSVVREIVLLHGGRIDARSEGAGRGSEFVVTLPLTSPKAG
jgi:signal transduction histidine kinase